MLGGGGRGVDGMTVPGREVGGHPLDLLFDLAAILCVAAGTTVVFKKVRQPIVLG
jgi:hypothetical protein